MSVWQTALWLVLAAPPSSDPVSPMITKLTRDVLIPVGAAVAIAGLIFGAIHLGGGSHKGITIIGFAIAAAVVIAFGPWMVGWIIANGPGLGA